MLRRFVPSPLVFLQQNKSNTFSISSPFCYFSSCNKFLQKQKVKINNDDDDGFGGTSQEEEIDIDDFVSGETTTTASTSSANDGVVFIQNGTSMDYTAFSSSSNNNNNSNTNSSSFAKVQDALIQKQQMEAQEASSSQFVARIWPELLQMSEAVEASQKVVMTIEDEISRTRQIGDGLQTQRAVEISRNLGSRSLFSNDGNNSNAVNEKMSPQDAAFCFGVLQSVVEQSNTRLDEKFVADVAYHVFSAELQVSNDKNSAKESGDALLLSVTEHRSVLASATASTWRSLVSSDFINDDYLLGIGLARCVDLVDSMDVSALCNLLEGLRKFDRIHFSLHEMDHYRKGAGAGDLDEASQVLNGEGENLDVMDRAGVHGAAVGARSTKTSPSLATLLREAMTSDANKSNVIHPNLIDLITQGVEKRVRVLIAEASAQMKKLEKEMTGEGDVERVRQLRLTENSTNGAKNDVQQGNKNDEIEKITTTTINLSSGAVDEEDNFERSTDNKESPAGNTKPQKNNFKQLATFVPICRPNDLLQLIAELCRIPNGVTDPLLWKELTSYSDKYFEWAKQKAKFDRFQQQLRYQAQGGQSSFLLEEGNTENNAGHHASLFPSFKRSLFETERLLALLPPLVKPITSINDSMDAIATSKRNKNNFLLVPNSNCAGDENALALIPTAGLLTLVSNELAQSASKHIQVIGKRNPDLIRNLRRAFEEFPVLYQTSPALWDVLRNQRLSRKVGGNVGCNNSNRSVTGLERRAGKLGQLPRYIPMDETVNRKRPLGGRAGRQRRILSRDIIEEDASQLPIVERKFKLDPDRRFRHVTGKWRDLRLDNRINGWKDAKKKRKFSKGKYNATRISEAAHQQNR